MLTEAHPDPVHQAGGTAPAGTFACLSCGQAVALDHLDELPECEACGGTEYRRASLFEQPTADSSAVDFAPREPDWLAAARAGLAPGSVSLAFLEAGRPRVVEIGLGWTRIGRSSAADLRLDDPTVSRRHAQVVRTEEDEVRVIDDRSLNGTFVNGELTEWAELADGDELAIGRFRLRLVVGAQAG